MFDFETVSTIDRNSFAPLPTKNLSSKKRHQWTEMYDNDSNNLYLVKVRPKVDVGLIGEDINMLHFAYFVRMLYMEPKRRVIPLIDEWNAKAALDAAKNGYSPYLMGTELKPSQIVDLFNILLRQPDYHSCGFGVAADQFTEL